MALFENTETTLTLAQQEAQDLRQQSVSVYSTIYSMLKGIATDYWKGTKVEIEARHALFSAAEQTLLESLFESQLTILEVAKPGSTAELAQIVIDGKAVLNG